jgi:hypothetical protein
MGSNKTDRLSPPHMRTTQPSSSDHLDHRAGVHHAAAGNDQDISLNSQEPMLITKSRNNRESEMCRRDGHQWATLYPNP